MTAPLPALGNRADLLADAGKKVLPGAAKKVLRVAAENVLLRSQNNFPDARKVQLLESGRCTIGCLTAGRPRKRCTCRCGGQHHGRAVGDTDPIGGAA